MKYNTFKKLNNDGYLIIPKVFTTKEVIKLRDLCNKIINNKNYKKNIKKPKQSKHKLNSHSQDNLIYNLQNKNEYQVLVV